MTVRLNNESEEQIMQCLNLLKNILGSDLLGVSLYGSSIIGGLQKYSDIDLFVVSNRSTNYIEKTNLVTSLLTISGIYKKTSKRPIEMTIVVKSEINPWQYPPKFDFQYGDWLRDDFESGNIEPWPNKVMPDLAILITQVLLANKKLLGPEPNQLLSRVPYHDFIAATVEELDNLMTNLNKDTCNVLLTLARIWSTVKTDQIHSKPDAAVWVINQLPEEYQPVMKQARAICIGKEYEKWDDIKPLIQLCAKFMVNQINELIALFKLSNDTNKSIRL